MASVPDGVLSTGLESRGSLSGDAREPESRLTETAAAQPDLFRHTFTTARTCPYHEKTTMAAARTSIDDFALGRDASSVQRRADRKAPPRLAVWRSSAPERG